jgi:hypothetical protein
MPRRELGVVVVSLWLHYFTWVETVAIAQRWLLSLEYFTTRKYLKPKSWGVDAVAERAD